MNWSSWLLWGFASTVVLTSILAGSQGVSLTRMNIPYLLGTIFTPNRDRAKFIGFFLHLANGWTFSLIYVAAFRYCTKRHGGSALVSDSFTAFLFSRWRFRFCLRCIREWPTNNTDQLLCANSSRPVSSVCTMAFVRRFRFSSHTPFLARSWAHFTS